jgi:hypothetical protein
MKSKSLLLGSQVLQITLMVLAVLFWVLLLVSGEDRVNPMIYLGYVVFFLSLAITVFSFVTSILMNPQALRGAFIGLGAFALILLVSYLFASGSDFEQYKNANEATVRWVNTGLNMFYIVSIITFGVVIYSGVARFFK